MAGADARDPQSFASDPTVFRRRRSSAISAACASPGALISAACRSIGASGRCSRPAHRRFEDLGCIVEDACPDFGDVNEIFLTLRTWASWNTYKDLLAQHRRQIKPEAIWDIESGAHLTGEDLGRRWSSRASCSSGCARSRRDTIPDLRGEPGAAIRRDEPGRSRSTAWRWRTTSRG